MKKNSRAIFSCTRMDLPCAPGNRLEFSFSDTKRKAKICVDHGEAYKSYMEIGGKRYERNMTLRHISSGNGAGFNCYIQIYGGEEKDHGHNPSDHLMNIIPDQIDIPCGSSTRIVAGNVVEPHSRPWAVFLWLGMWQ